MDTVLRSQTLPAYPDYAVFDDGRVYSQRLGDFLKPCKDPKGYLMVTLYSRDGRERRKVRIQRLVALAFLGAPPPEKTHVLHANGNRTDNRLHNLRYGDQADNTEDMRRHGTLRVGAACNTTKLTPEDVAEIRTTEGVTFVALAVKYGVGPSAIADIIHYRSWKHLQ